MNKPIHSIKQNPYRRRLAISLAGMKGGSRLVVGSAVNLLKSGVDRRLANNDLLRKEAMRFVEELGRLKGGYVKCGQLLAIYGEQLLAEPILEALRTLNDQTAQLSWPAIAAALKRELGPAMAEFEIDQRPLAAASLAQVHRAIHLPTGRAVCLKVQYPGVANAIERDLDDIVQMLRLSRWLLRDHETSSMLAEIRRLLRQEVDYRQEAAAAEEMERRLTRSSHIVVPKMHTRFCTERLLVMDFIGGLKLDSAEVKALPAKRRNQIGASILDLLFRELFEWQFMQTDPNLGNYLVQVGQRSDKLVLLDFGAMRALSTSFCNSLRETTVAAVERSVERTCAGLQAMGCVGKDLDGEAKQAFADLCFLLVEPICTRAPSAPTEAMGPEGTYRWQHANLVRRIGRSALSSVPNKGFKFPGNEFSLVLRKLAGVYNTLAMLNAELNSNALFKRRAGTEESHSTS